MLPELAATPLAGLETAPPFLVLPSLGGTHEDWRAAAGFLAERWQVLGVDLPGHGASAAAVEPFTVAELAAGVLAVADRLGARSFGVAGVSLGGAVVQELALLAPARIEFAGVICSAPAMGTPEVWIERAASVRRGGTGTLTEGLAERWFSVGFRAAEPDTVGRVLAGVAATDDESYALCCEALRDFDLRERAATIAVPIRLVRGADDPVAPAEAVRALEQAARVTGTVLPGVRHQAAIERPDAVAAALLAP
ncbi:MAG: alpha/beta hydrolase [Naasia sp.]|nr:alpha/beta hydrolase [Naasia sp.]